MDIQIFNVTGYEMLRKRVGKGPDSGRIYLPKKWIGKHVTVVLADYPDEKC